MSINPEAPEPEPINTPALARQSFETTPGELIRLGANQRIRFFRVFRPYGHLEGAFWLGLKDHLIGFIPTDPAADNAWGAIIVGALQNSGFDGRPAFEYWSRGSTTGTWDSGVVEEIDDLDALIALIRRERPAKP